MPQKTTVCVLYGVLALAFWALPFAMQDTGGAMFGLLVLLPAVCLIVSVIHGWKLGFRWQHPLITMLLFVPAVPLHFNSSAWVYIVIYGAFALLGEGLGAALRRI